jgi:hypothetical protein
LAGHHLDVEFPGARHRQEFPNIAQQDNGLAMRLVGPGSGRGRRGDLLGRFGIGIGILEQP